MAGDWIRMRVWLSRDPKVIRMADWLAGQRDFMNWLTDPVQQSCRETAYEHVTRNVTVALCVTGLLVIWGTAREQGDRDGDDLILDQCDAETLSAVADIPAFGRAMVEVGWIRELEDGRTVFPKFFKDHESPEDRHRRQNADRQARHRREEKRRVTPIVPATPQFDSFWKAYPGPRKVGKAKCLHHWRTHGFDALADQILLHVAAMAQTPQWLEANGKYIPAPLTYLNQRRFEDGFPEAPRVRLAI
jgi:hypothetical protein